MSSLVPRHSPSQTPRHSPTHSSTASSSPRRRPLHERSQSQTNASPTRSAVVLKDSKIYEQTPFPRLPSQVFPPTTVSPPFVFEDVAETPPIPPKSPLRPATPSNSPSSDDENDRTLDSSQIPTIPPLFSSSNTSLPEDESHTAPSGRRKGKEKAQGPHVRDKAQAFEALDKMNKAVLVPKKQKVDPSDTFAGRKRRHKAPQKDHVHHKSVERLRSQSSARPKPAESPVDASSSSSSSSPRSRPRSASSPERATEAFIEQLINNEAILQYPKIRQPSAYSMRTDAALTRVSYPPPLRLQRKRANSQLGRAGSETIQSPEHQYESQSTTLRPAPSQTSILSNSTTESTYGTAVVDQPSAILARLSGNWADELGDVVAELQPQNLRRQRSDFQIASRPTSRSDTDESGRSRPGSRPGSFYKFLNDSVTDWAHIYYRNESRVRLGTPPHVTSLQPSPDFIQSTPTRQPSITTSLGDSQSPGSAGFPETLYIRRLRPHSVQIATANPDIRPTEHHSISTVVTASNTVTSSNRDRRDSVITIPPPTPPYNPTPALPQLPHLGEDRRARDSPSFWRTPSLDVSSRNPFNALNLQIILFCIGFIFPPAWWLAAFLSLPPRPQWERPNPEMQERGARESQTRVRESVKSDMTATDLFDEQDMARWRKARWWRNMNRVMAVVGLLVTAAVVACAVVATR